MRQLVTAILLSFLATGCYVQSLNVFYTDDAKTTLPEVLGDWRLVTRCGDSVTNKSIAAWAFAVDTLATYDEDHNYSQLEVVYFRVQDTYFMDFTAGEPIKDSEQCGNFYWGAGITLVHSLCKLDITENSLTLTPADIDWFANGIEAGAPALPYVKPTHEDGNYLFTATPEQWMAFLAAHKENDEVFNPECRFVFTRDK